MIGYLGPSGTFSQLAAIEYTKEKKEALKEFPTIYALIQAVESGCIDSAIVPIENSIEGSVNVTLDTLAFDVDLFIIDEYVLKITQNLLVKPGASQNDIKTIISHPQGIGQCSKMLNRDFPDAEIVFAASTAEAGKTVAEGDKSTAVIASENCAKLYGLDILMPDCSDERNNFTRFVIISKKQCTKVTEQDKTSIVFTLDDKPGSLYRALSHFEKSEINLLKIQSRPLKKELGKYIFFVDIEGNIDNPTIYFALDALKASTSFYKFLGSYKRQL
ncbi:MAG: prephenate dehydratase [Clostridia bacterium]|nr:prephenate dehydratase [Clostridia bacterium]